VSTETHEPAIEVAKLRKSSVSPHGKYFALRSQYATTNFPS
jgi:hypothetical protein